MADETAVYPEGVGIAHWFSPARSQGYPPGRSFLRRMINLLSAFRSPAHPIRLNLEFRCDLAWWREFFTTWDGVSFFRMPSISSFPDLFVATDAAGSVGFGTIWGTAWLPVPGLRLGPRPLSPIWRFFPSSWRLMCGVIAGSDQRYSSCVIMPQSSRSSIPVHPRISPSCTLSAA